MKKGSGAAISNQKSAVSSQLLAVSGQLSDRQRISPIDTSYKYKCNRLLTADS